MRRYILNIKYFFLGFFVFFNIAQISAQLQLSFNNLLIEDGLSQNSVMAITQDKSNYMWFGTRQGLNRFDGHKIKIFKHDSSIPASLSNNEISWLLTDSDGKLWIGTAKGLDIYNQKEDTFEHISLFNNNTIEVIYQAPDKNIWVGTKKGLYLLVDSQKNIFRALKPKNKSSLFYVTSIFKDSKQNLWVGTIDGLLCFTQKNGKFNYERFTQKKGANNSLPSSYITAIAQDNIGNLFIGTDNGLAIFNYQNKTFSNYHYIKNQNSLVHNDIREIKPDLKGSVWIGTQEGLSILNVATKKFTNYQHDPEIDNTISHNSIHNIFQDNNHNMWIGTYYGGANIVYSVSTKFKIYRNSRIAPSISGNVISSIVEDKYKNLWIGTEGGGLNYFDRKTNSFKSYKTNPNDENTITSNLVKVICKESLTSDNLIIGTHKGGINVFNPSDGKFIHIRNVRNSANETGTAEILALASGADGTIWIGSANGLSTLKKINGVYPNHTTKSILDKYFKKKSILCLYENNKQELWIGTTAGLYCYIFKTKELKQYVKNSNNKSKLQSDFINCINQNAKGELLIGTQSGGLSIYNPQSGTFTTYSTKDGLVNDDVLGVIEDENHNLWISTSNGLSELNIKTNRFRNYTKSDGTAGNEFNLRSFYKDSSGEIFLGGTNGLTSFKPSEIQINKYVAPIFLTGLKLFNQNIEVNGEDKLLKEQIGSSKKLSFKHDQNHFTIEFAVLNYIKPDKNKYSYKLEGYDKEWIHTTTPSATYTNLPAGNYHFVVRGINNDGIPSGNNAEIDVEICPPIWASWWAYTFYIILFSAILFLIVRFFFIRALLKRNEDIQQMKLNFFTNVSHEIRTPLTLIIGPLEVLISKTKALPEINNQLLAINNNANRLMRLVTELMDFRKTETGNLKLKVSGINLNEFIGDIFKSFEYLANSRNITYTFKHDENNIEAWIDKKEMEKVVFNLISNAFKFTPENGSITITTAESTNNIIVKVEDSGLGIPLESQDKLFSAFFQVDTPQINHIGSGIGLALSKSIINAHGGNIALQSTPATESTSGYTCLTIELKKGYTHFDKNVLTTDIINNEVRNSIYTPEEPTTNIDFLDTQKASKSETILIIDDNQEIREVLRNVFLNKYQIEESENGLLGFEKAIELLPDIIICDVMMPVMDGLEFCKKIKTDPRTSHIPVILLTAKASHDHQVDGLENGADNYISKPFSPEILKLNVRNLLDFRHKIRQKYSLQINLQPKDITVNTTEQAFMVKTIKCIEDSMTDQDFGVQELAMQIGMSQPVLYKKIRAVTDLSVNDFIKSIRLKKAATLLSQREYNVSEISYLIGFNDPKYFSREFKKQYGYTPKEYIKTLTDQDK